MSTNKVLTLRFKLATGKKYSVRVKDANPAVTPDSVQQLADLIIKQKAFNFDGKQTAYTFDGATYTTTSKKDVMAGYSAK